MHEIDAVHELHGEEALRVLDDELVQGHQVPVGDVGQAAELSFEVIEISRVDAQQRLQCDDLVAGPVVHFVDNAHAARAEGPQDGETLRPGKLAPRLEWVGGAPGSRRLIGRVQDLEADRGRLFEEITRRLVSRDELFHRLADPLVAEAGVVEKRRALVGVARDRGLEHGEGPSPSPGIHR